MATRPTAQAYWIYPDAKKIVPDAKAVIREAESKGLISPNLSALLESDPDKTEVGMLIVAIKYWLDKGASPILISEGLSVNPDSITFDPDWVSVIYLEDGHMNYRNWNADVLYRRMTYKFNPHKQSKVMRFGDGVRRMFQLLLTSIRHGGDRTDKYFYFCIKNGRDLLQHCDSLKLSTQYLSVLTRLVCFLRYCLDDASWDVAKYKLRVDGPQLQRRRNIAVPDWLGRRTFTSYRELTEQDWASERLENVTSLLEWKEADCRLVSDIIYEKY